MTDVTVDPDEAAQLRAKIIDQLRAEDWTVRGRWSGDVFG